MAKCFKKVHSKEIENIRKMQATEFMVNHKDKSNVNDEVHFVINSYSPAGIDTEFMHTWPKFKVPLYKLRGNVLCHTHLPYDVHITDVAHRA
jgi:hypothetical protein